VGGEASTPGCPAVVRGMCRKFHVFMCPTVVHLQVHLGFPVVKDMCRNCHVSNRSKSTGLFVVSCSKRHVQELSCVQL